MLPPTTNYHSPYHVTLPLYTVYMGFVSRHSLMKVAVSYQNVSIVCEASLASVNGVKHVTVHSHSGLTSVHVCVCVCVCVCVRACVRACVRVCV